MNLLKNIIGNWIQIIDQKNLTTIEDFSYETGANGTILSKHCEKCIAVNQCWFKNENNKKPLPFETTSFKNIDKFISILTPGLYHFGCHCEEVSIPTPSIQDITLIIPNGKIEWLFSDKSEWIKAMGYNTDLKFINILKPLIKQAYYCGQYEIINHSKYGTKINLLLDLPNGQNKNKKYKIKSNFMIFPNGKLKCNTLIGGWQK